MGWQDRAYNRSDSYGSGPKLADYLPKGLTLALIVAVLGIFLLQTFGPERFLVEWGSLTFIDHLGWKQPWRFITYQYLHASGSHIFWNMLGIYFLVPLVEQIWGWRRALAFYTVGGIVAGLTYAGICYFFGNGLLVGASGSILAMLGVIAALMPGLMFFGFIPARIMAILVGVLYLLTLSHDRSAADAAHLGGLVFGYVAPLVGTGFFNEWTGRLKQNRQWRMVQDERAEEAEIDRILQKVRDQGMNSLRKSERNQLKKATERQRASDAKRRRV
jgi:membrane associated rhomboid family serine protease